LPTATTRELRQRRDFNTTDGCGVSFDYGGRSSSQFLNDWKLEQKDLPETADCSARQFTRTDPVTQLQCTVILKQYKHFPVVEWTANFKNGGTKDSPMLENLRSMDLLFPASDKLQLHHHTGDYANEDSYEPHITQLVAGTQLHFAPQGGRPTDTAWPYYNLENTTEHAGVIVVVGWPGQWSADFSRSADESAIASHLRGAGAHSLRSASRRRGARTDLGAPVLPGRFGPLAEHLAAMDARGKHSASLRQTS